MNTPVDIYDINKFFDEMKVKGKFRPIIKNEEVRVATPLLFYLRGQSVFLMGDAGTCKTGIIEGVALLCYDESVFDNDCPEIFWYSGGSDKALLNKDVEQRLQEEVKFCIIPELQNVYRGSDDRNEDILKAWLEGRNFSYDRTTQGGRGSEHIMIPYKPVLTSLATENKRLNDKNNFNEELERRAVIMYTESNLELNGLVHRRKAELEALPNSAIFVGGLDKLPSIRDHILDVIEQDFDGLISIRMGAEDVLNKPIEIKNPCAPFMEKLIPKKFAVSNTIIGYWHEAVKAVTSWYYLDRIKTDEYIFSTPTDNYIAWVLLGDTVVNASLKIKEIGRVLLDMIPIKKPKTREDYLSGIGEDEYIQLDGIIDKLKAMGIEKSKAHVEDSLNRLIFASYIRYDEKNQGYYKTQDYSSDIHKSINWSAVIDDTRTWMRRYYPDVADQYIAEHCDVARCVHPLNGELVDLHGIKAVQVEEKEDIAMAVPSSKKVADLSAIWEEA